jgi:hypothetical protein
MVKWNFHGPAKFLGNSLSTFTNSHFYRVVTTVLPFAILQLTLTTSQFILIAFCQSELVLHFPSLHFLLLSGQMYCFVQAPAVAELALCVIKERLVSHLLHSSANRRNPQCSHDEIAALHTTTLCHLEQLLLLLEG